jgi:hypothetical protein
MNHHCVLDDPMAVMTAPRRGSVCSRAYGENPRESESGKWCLVHLSLHEMQPPSRPVMARQCLNPAPRTPFRETGRQRPVKQAQTSSSVRLEVPKIPRGAMQAGCARTHRRHQKYSRSTPRQQPAVRGVQPPSGACPSPLGALNVFAMKPTASLAPWPPRAPFLADLRRLAWITISTN